MERIENIGPYIVACLDNELLELCRAHNIPAFYARSAEIIGDRQNLGSNAGAQEKQNIGADRCVPMQCALDSGSETSLNWMKRDSSHPAVSLSTPKSVHNSPQPKESSTTVSRSDIR